MQVGFGGVDEIQPQDEFPVAAEQVKAVAVVVGLLHVTAIRELLELLASRRRAVGTREEQSGYSRTASTIPGRRDDPR